MRKGEQVEEMLIAPEISIQVFIDEYGAGQWRICKAENGHQLCSKSAMITSEPVVEIITERLPGNCRFVVVYVKSNGSVYIKKGGYSGQKVWWTEEISEEDYWVEELWMLRN